MVHSPTNPLTAFYLSPLGPVELMVGTALASFTYRFIEKKKGKIPSAIAGTQGVDREGHLTS